MLFMGAFMMSKALEHWGAHRRIAHAMLSRVGSTTGPRVLLAMMLAIMVCHFGVNNTVIALMMTPVALAIVEREESGKLATPLLLGVAYCASIFGIVTPISTAPNGIFQAVYKELTGQTIPFYQWMIVGGTAAMLMMFAAWGVLSWGIRGVTSVQVEAEGGWTRPQLRTLFICGLAAVGWITRDIPFGGWQRWVPQLEGRPAAGDMTVAVSAALLMFLLPSGERGERGEKCDSRLLDWKTAATIPWGVLVLFGGGIAIAKAFESSGLSEVVGRAVYGIQDWPPLALIGVLCLAVTFLSEFTSNTATAAILMPILGAAAKTNGMDPALLMFPATLANSLAFMMPVGTPPNAIVYGTGRVRIIDMVRHGFVLNLIGVVIVTLVCWQMLPMVFGVAAGKN
jgi:sodium-dependent dicarboxylate transporter 2/3/5